MCGGSSDHSKNEKLFQNFEQQQF
jgi:hypothetical protein